MYDEGTFDLLWGARDSLKQTRVSPTYRIRNNKQQTSYPIHGQQTHQARAYTPQPPPSMLSNTPGAPRVQQCGPKDHKWQNIAGLTSDLEGGFIRSRPGGKVGLPSPGSHLTACGDVDKRAELGSRVLGMGVWGSSTVFGRLFVCVVNTFLGLSTLCAESSFDL